MPGTPDPDLIVIFGLGFTGKRLARRLLDRGIPVCAAVRDPGRFADLVQSGLRLNREFPKNAAIFYSIPPLSAEEESRIESQIRALEPSRIVYISSTAVYGEQSEVNENTLANPNDARGRVRLDAENRIEAGPWTSLILRAAAIYGPGRGVHTALRDGRLPRGAGAGVVSRIHVDDLAAHAEAGLFADIKGAWPVADDAPCSSAEIAEWLGIQLNDAREFTIAGRRVDGRKIREILGIKLNYSTWETGIPASIKEERDAENLSL
jgi:nucleoside-diphosphate-sugar epimerase